MSDRCLSYGEPFCDYCLRCDLLNSCVKRKKEAEK